MNRLIFGFVVVLAISAVNAGIYGLAEQHESYQTQFLPIASPQVSFAGLQNTHIEHLPIAQAAHALPVEGPLVSAVPHVQPTPFHLNQLEATPVAFAQTVQQVLPQPSVELQKTVVKHVEVPYKVNKYVKVDRQVPVPVNRYVKVDRPYEVIKYVQKPYIVKVEKKIHVPVISKVAIPQPIVEVEPVVAEPIKIHAHAQSHQQHNGPQPGWQTD